MQYSRKNLIDQVIAGHQPEYLLFWGHRPSKDGRLTSSCFSQWWKSSFAVDGVTYATAEHWMMACKARLFGDSEMLKQILAEPAPDKVKRLGRKVSGIDTATWNAHKYAFVREGNLHKFSQHPAMKAFLLSTGEQVIVEASPYDTIWGIGLGANAPEALDPREWRGENLLGFALMEVRDQLRKG
jgi:ribA/ribD-fused uncharacterized protein